MLDRDADIYILSPVFVNFRKLHIIYDSRVVLWFNKVWSEVRGCVVGLRVVPGSAVSVFLAQQLTGNLSQEGINKKKAEEKSV